MTKERKKISFFLAIDRDWNVEVIFITTIDLICNVILDHIKKF